MDLGMDGRNEESLLASQQEKTARRTSNLQEAARLIFLLAHGALVIMASLMLGVEEQWSWWFVFSPVWIAHATCAILVVFSCFASCPYIKLCLAERQARLGDTNPSILTDLLPAIIMAVFGFLFLILALVGELMLCSHLDRTQQGKTDTSVVPCAVALIISAMAACCRGICIRTDGDLFNILGAGTLATFIAAIFLPDGLLGRSGWLLLLPSFLSATGMLVCAVRSFRRRSPVLCHEERILRLLEQGALVVVANALAAGAWELASTESARGPSPSDPALTGAAAAGVTAGCAICIIAGLRVRMALVECKTRPVAERDVQWAATLPLSNNPIFAEPVRPASSGGAGGPRGVHAGNSRN